MPKATSKAQQRKFWAMAGRGKITEAQARAHSKEGKAYKRLPERKRSKKKR